ncbi:stress responsive protein [Limnohabitans sp. JirII-29]|uniref:Dabb family protein n=1 Tax=unclassified Limnohabitans TaxID=2626134 RepID=UPI000C1EC17D|nr:MULTISPECIES: Dabb family protein [unclassified Limnohabitans]PIT77371.1 stress responsive protein [Limnohabitans sp. JirII-31]PUE28525.1 stress responsive protein [Limnohabitans sp. JirII-29]
MIKHIVMWDVQGDTPAQKQANRQLIQSQFEALRGHIPGLLHVEVGIDHSHVDYACDVVLYTEFDSQESLDAYASHPAHLRVKQTLGAVRIARHQVDFVSTSVA